MSVTDVIARLRAQGNSVKRYSEEYENPQPLAASVVVALKLPTGESVPADLSEWLQYDASWFPVLEDDNESFRARPLREVLETWLDDMRDSDDEDVEEELEELEELVGDDVLGYWLKSLPDPALADVHTVELPHPLTDQEPLLMLEPGRESLRVLGCHKRIEFWWKYQSFAAYLAHSLGFEDPA
jgi:hypothetical protein